MKNFKKLLAFLLAGVMIVSLGGCGKDQTTDETPAQDEVIEDVPLMEIDGAAEEPVEEEPEVVVLTEDDLKDFVEFSNLYVLRQEEPVDPAADEDALDTDETVEDTETEALATEDDEDAAANEEDAVTEDEDAAAEDETMEDTEDVSEASEEIEIDPYGYVAAVNIKDPLVVREIAYDDTLVDVYTQGDYELFYLAVVDEDAYNEALLSPAPVIGDSEEPAVDADDAENEIIEDDAAADDTSVDADADEDAEDVVDDSVTEVTDEPSEELPEPEHVIYGEIHKVVRVVEPEEYDEMLENGDIVEVVDGTAILAPESEIEEIQVEEVEFTRPAGYKTQTSTGKSTTSSYVPTYKNGSGSVVSVPKPSSSSNSSNNSSNSNNSNSTESEHTTVPTATDNAATATEKPSATETPDTQNTTTPTTTSTPTATPKATATASPTATPKATTTSTPTATPKPTATATPTSTTCTTHSWGAWATVTAATCTTGGTMERTCWVCGQSETKSIAATGHTWATTTVHHDEVGHYEETTVQTGTKPIYEQQRTWVGSAAVCNVCGAVFYDADSLTDHLVENGHSGYYSKDLYEYEDVIVGYEPVYTTQKTWVVDTAAYDETITKCTVCGVTK